MSPLDSTHVHALGTREFSDSVATSHIQDTFVSQSTIPYQLEILSMLINTRAYPLQARILRLIGQLAIAIVIY